MPEEIQRQDDYDACHSPYVGDDVPPVPSPPHDIPHLNSTDPVQNFQNLDSEPLDSEPPPPQPLELRTKAAGHRSMEASSSSSQMTKPIIYVIVRGLVLQNKSGIVRTAMEIQKNANWCLKPLTSESGTTMHSIRRTELKFCLILRLGVILLTFTFHRASVTRTLQNNCP